MNVGILQLQLLIPGSHSLKEKRGVIRSLKDRSKRKFNVAIAEVDEQDHWQIAVLGIVTVGVDAHYCERVLRSFISFAEEYRDADIGDYQLEVI